ncbi:ABC transporter substrate-binding protein [Protofrankia symbiont of Coriaria ruscifolia]|uniref:ABC transporter substrate-binding protein n=1 Tax=Protofrankia symbiont of Coriaria ruscifolia TaxID=1306542 RepID=UPI0010416358|nr:ABC transporter substrate-binding protein [Protofrankia symbiont of Coriaria ruscifolia]
MSSSLTVALVTPLTGPAAAYGLATLRAATLWARDEQLPLPWDDVNVTAYDAHPHPAAAMRSAAAAEPDAIFGPYGQRSALAACAATDRVVFNIGAPSTRFVRQTFPNVVNLLSPHSTWTRGLLAAVRAADRRARKVTVLVASDDRALEVVSVVRAAATRLGFEVTSSVFRPGRAMIAARRLPPADVLIVQGDPDDETAAAEVLLRRPWRAAAFSTAGHDDALTTLRNRRDGLLGPRAWSPQLPAAAGTGPSVSEFVAYYRRMYDQLPAATAAVAYTAGLVLGRCIRANGRADDRCVLAAARTLDTSTLLGRFRLDRATGLQVGHHSHLVQWQDGVARVVWPANRAQSPLAYPRSQIGVAGQRAMTAS